MHSIWTRLENWRGATDGQDLLEYALLVALIAIVAVGAVTTVSNVVTGVFWNTIAAASF
jgi:Flp pilus assembly pilin Flp